MRARRLYSSKDSCFTAQIEKYVGATSYSINRNPINSVVAMEVTSYDLWSSRTRVYA
jgi:hypothetical protein